MPHRNRDLHGSAPDKSDTALLLIDVINALEFPEADQLLQRALPMARKIAALKRRATAADIPVIYVNDNFGRWRSDFQSLVEHCRRPESRGREMVEILRPDDDDYFILKPKHSGFYATALDTLLDYLGTRRIILTGVAGNICVLFTANDVYIRDFELIVPADCIASNTVEENQYALHQMERILKADVRRSDEIRLKAED